MLYRSDCILLLQFVLLSFVHSNPRHECDHTRTDSGHKIHCHVDGASIRTFSLGDFGGSDTAPYCTKAQMECADFIQKMGPTKDPQFFTGTGDNIYYYGVQSVDSSRFKDTFDDVFLYGKNELIPWYLIAGNHDWYGQVSAQIEYSKHNKRWVFPDYSYTVRYDTKMRNGPSVEFIFVDTIVLCGQTWDDKAPGHGRNGKPGHKIEYPTGPKDAEWANRTLHWLENELKHSSATYLVVVGHYPVFSATTYQHSRCLLSHVQPMLDKYGATAYLSGHEHNLQHITSSTPSGHMMHHIVSGAGHMSEAIEEPLKPKHDEWNVASHAFFPKRRTERVLDIGGIVYIEFTSTHGIVEFYNCNGEQLHSFTLPQRTRIHH